MREHKITKIIDNDLQSKKAFNPIREKQTSPIVKQMTKFIHFNLLNEKSIFKGLSRFKPEDLR